MHIWTLKKISSNTLVSGDIQVSGASTYISKFIQNMSLDIYGLQHFLFLETPW